MKTKARTKVRRKQTKAGVRWYPVLVHEDGGEDALGGYGTQKEAKAVAAEALADSKRGDYVEPSELTVAAFLLDEWIPSRRNADISVTTRDTDITVVESWIVPHIGSTPLQRLRPKDVDDLYATLREHGGRGGRPLKGNSVRNVHFTLVAALDAAVRRGYAKTNPVRAIDPPARDDSTERTSWTKEEAVRFLKVAAADRLGAIWRLALSTGLRRGELLGLDWDAVDMEQHTVKVARQVFVRPRATPSEPRVIIRETTKTRRTRLVRFDETTAVALRGWKAAQAADKLQFGPAYRSDGGLGVEAPWLVTEPNGYVVAPETFLGRRQRLVKAAGVPAIGIHGARHSFASLSLEAGVRLDIVSGQLGHSNVATTANIYAHVSEAAAVEAAEKLGQILEGGPDDGRGEIPGTRRPLVRAVGERGTCWSAIRSCWGNIGGMTRPRAY